MTSRYPARRGTGLVLGGTAVAVGLALSGCGAPDVVGHPPSHPSGVSAQPTSTSNASSGPFAPLTGLPVSAARAGRPVVALAIAGANPHGLGQADVVYEEISSPIRYLALFQSRQASRVGPITATRPSDGMIAGVLHAAVGYDGGTAGFIDVLHHQQVRDMGEAVRPSLYHAGPAGVTTGTAGFAAGRPRPAPQFFPFRGEGLLASHQLADSGTWRAARAEIRMPGAPAEEWRYDAAAHLWQRTAGGPAASVANLIVQLVPYKQVFLSHRDGITTPSAMIFGAGHATVLSGTAQTPAAGTLGLAVHANWAKPGVSDLTVYTAAGHGPVGFAPGRSWVILAPPGTRVTTTRSRS
ncbi:MAG TPA: DUF3048 domain-containing protein [Streptosporangiaceae bacterium]